MTEDQQITKQIFSLNRGKKVKVYLSSIFTCLIRTPITVISEIFIF